MQITMQEGVDLIVRTIGGAKYRIIDRKRVPSVEIFTEEMGFVPAHVSDVVRLDIEREGMTVELASGNVIRTPSVTGVEHVYYPYE